MAPGDRLYEHLDSAMPADGMRKTFPPDNGAPSGALLAIIGNSTRASTTPAWGCGRAAPLATSAGPTS